MAIVEMRTYTLLPGTTAKVEERFEKALPGRVKVSPLGAFLHTEVGPLNQVIHMWPYDSLADRTEKRAEAAKSETWPPDIREFIVEQESKILIPAPFSPPLKEQALGSCYEIRTYTMGPGSIPGQIDAWSKKIEERVKVSPLVGAYYTELGPLNQWIHIWAYKDAAERQRLRAEAARLGVWPPERPQGVVLLKQENCLAVPASFSPSH